MPDRFIEKHSKCFCTIITADYLQYVYVLNESLLQFNGSIRLNVLISDTPENAFDAGETFDNIRFYFVDDICRGGIGKKIREKYQETSMDSFRWSMKPVFIRYLFNENGYEKVVYIDSDICFYNDYSFLFEELDQNNIVLTPHWCSSDPRADYINFINLYTCGLYNAGFVGFNRNARDALDWWAEACEFICVIDRTRGQYVDQAHLNLFPVYFDNVKVLKHRGCNVAGWNQVECRRVKDADNTVWINGDTPIIFIHFSPYTIQPILSGEDAALSAYLQDYYDRLRKYGAEIRPPKIRRTPAGKRIINRFVNSGVYGRLDKNGSIRRYARQLSQRLFS